MKEKDIVHILANDYVNNHEQSDLIKMQIALSQYTPKSYWWEKTNDAIFKEMNRIYRDDEDHEEIWVDGQKFDKWMKGDDAAWDE